MPSKYYSAIINQVNFVKHRKTVNKNAFTGDTLVKPREDGYFKEQ